MAERKQRNTRPRPPCAGESCTSTNGHGVECRGGLIECRGKYGCGEMLPGCQFDRDNRMKRGRQSCCAACAFARKCALVAAKPTVAAKHCAVCGWWLLAEKFNRGYSKGGLQSACKACEAARQREYVERNRAANADGPSVLEKWCSSCSTTKPAEAFSASRKTSDGLHGQCRECNAAYRQTPAGKAVDRKSKHKRRAHEAGCPGDGWSADEAQEMWEMQDGLCALCGEPMYDCPDDPPWLEHIFPISTDWGSNLPHDLVWTHESCNNNRHKADPWIARLQALRGDDPDFWEWVASLPVVYVDDAGNRFESWCEFVDQGVSLPKESVQDS